MGSLLVQDIEWVYAGEDPVVRIYLGETIMWTHFIPEDMFGFYTPDPEDAEG